MWCSIASPATTGAGDAHIVDDLRIAWRCSATACASGRVAIAWRGCTRVCARGSRVRRACRRRRCALAAAFAQVRTWMAETWPKRTQIPLSEIVPKVMAAQYEAIGAAADRFEAKACDVLVASGVFSSAAAARCVAEKRGMRYVHASYCPLFLPSPHQRPFEYPSHPHPRGMTDNQALWDRDVQVMNEIFGVGLNALR